MEFNDSTLGTVALAPIGYQQDEAVSQVTAFTYAEIKGVTDRRPRSITLEIRVHPRPNVHVFVVVGGKAIVVQDNVFTLDVPVEWNGEIPHTRKKGCDNLDVILLDPKGELIDIQCGIVTRNKGKFYATAQRIFKGNVVRTRKAGTSDIFWTFTPTARVHAYPGSSYGSLWAKMAEQVMSQALGEGASSQRSALTPVSWNPPPLSSVADEGRWREAVVLWFNMITGDASIQDAAGKKWYVHFSNIINVPAGEIPTLLPMTMVFFRPGEEGKAKSVKLPVAA